MSIYEFLERLEKDPFDPGLNALFLGKLEKEQEKKVCPGQLRKS